MICVQLQSTPAYGRVYWAYCSVGGAMGNECQLCKFALSIPSVSEAPHSPSPLLPPFPSLPTLPTASILFVGFPGCRNSYHQPDCDCLPSTSTKRDDCAVCSSCGCRTGSWRPAAFRWAQSLWKHCCARDGWFWLNFAACCALLKIATIASLVSLQISPSSFPHFGSSLHSQFSTEVLESSQSYLENVSPDQFPATLVYWLPFAPHFQHVVPDGV